MSRAPKINQNAPGARQINPRIVQERIERDLKDREMERTPEPGSHDWINPETATPGPAEARTEARLRQALKNGQPPVLSNAERQKWEAEAKRLEGWLRERMVPKKGMGLRNSQDPDFQKAVKIAASVEMSREFVMVAGRWKNIMRTLFYDEPYMANLDRIRPN